MPLCHCGNNKTPSSCCLLKVSSKPWTGLPKKVPIKQAIADAERFAQQGNWPVCLLICEHVINKVKGHPKAVYLTALHALTTGNAGRAVVLLKSIYEFQNSQLSYLLNYINALNQIQDHPSVIDVIEAHKDVLTSDSRGLKLAIDIFTQLECFDRVIEYATILMHIEPNVVEHRLFLANAYHRLLDDSAALEILDAALRAFPHHPELLFSKASLLEIQNNDKQALAILSPIIEQATSNAHWYVLASKLSRKMANVNEAATYLAYAEAHVSENNLEVQRAYFSEKLALARLSNDYQGAFDAAAMAKNKRAAPCEKDWLTLAQQRASIANFSHTSYGVSEDKSAKSPHLYILGFPRCGSTLLERLCCSHYKAVSYGESSAIPNAIGALSNKVTDAWWGLTFEQWNQASQYSLESPNAYNSGTPSVDKNLFNALRLPFIRQLDSHAVIIRCVRDPLAVVLSNYFANFMHYEPWQYSADTISQYLMHVDAVWQSTANQLDQRIITIKYEDIVQHQGMTPALDEFLMRYWLAEKAESQEVDVRAQAFKTRTASYEQVTKTIVNKANSEYTHYISMIPPSAKARIAELQAKWGYDNSVD